MESTLREAAESAGRTVRQSFVFSGRTRRLDVLYYWVASMLVTAAVEGAVTATMSWDSALVARNAVKLVVLIPWFSLFARRLHDIGRSGWWVLCLPPVVAANLYENVRVNLHAFDPAWPGLGMWGLVLLIPVLLALAVTLLPGDVDENRYGPDPRLTPPKVGAI
jgi:uncharacterized membrane protein YhaH (DUF805 family)